MNAQKEDQNRLSNQDMREFQTTESGIEASGGITKPDIQPSEPKDKNPNIENKSGDPGRTPGKAEGSRETVEEDLEEKNIEKD